MSKYSTILNDEVLSSINKTLTSLEDGACISDWEALALYDSHELLRKENAALKEQLRAAESIFETIQENGTELWNDSDSDLDKWLARTKQLLEK